MLKAHVALSEWTLRSVQINTGPIHQGTVERARRASPEEECRRLGERDGKWQWETPALG